MEDSRYIDKVNKTHNIESARKRKLKKRTVKYVLLVIGLIIIFVVSSYVVLFKISNVKYVGNKHYTTDELANALGVSEGDLLFGFFKSKKENMILENFPYISECTITRTVPDKVTVTVVEREAAMYTCVSGKYALFDEEMTVVELANEAPSELLCVEFDENVILKCVLGQKIVFDDEKTGVGIKRVYDALIASDGYNNVKSLMVESRFDYYLNYADKYEVYLGDSNDCESKLLFMYGIMEKLYDEDEGVIDVSNPKEGIFRKKG